jgi:hypothetical protein
MRFWVFLLGRITFTDKMRSGFVLQQHFLAIDVQFRLLLSGWNSHATALSGGVYVRNAVEFCVV